MSETVIEVKDLNKVFKDFWGRPKAKAVNDLSFSVQKGQVYGLLGPNGSGKSTTIKMLLGLLFPSSGSIRVFGEKPTHLDMKKRIGYLPEETILYRYLNPEEILDFYGALFKIPKAERKKRADQLIEMVGLDKARKRPVGEFSKGMARRIGLAQALINDPDLIILDEPTSGLDPVGCREVKDLIRVLAARGKTIILTSHLLADVEDVVDAVAVMYGGYMRSEGKLGDLLELKQKHTLTLEDVDASTLAKIKAFIAQETKEKAEFTHPVRSLEEVFLDVITSAKSDAIETSGAEYSGKVADYLSEGQDSQVNQAALQQLMQEDVVQVKPETIAPMNSEKLDDLVEELPEEKSVSTPVSNEDPKAETTVENAEEVNDKLKNLLGK